MQKVCAKLVPKNLNPIEDDLNFTSNVVTCDETWIFQYDPETKRPSMHWKTPTSPRMEKARMSKSKFKAMLLVFFDIKGVIRDDAGYPCPRCGNTYQVLGSLRRHVKYDCGRVLRPTITGYTVSSEGYVCQTCNRSYKGFASLKRHLKYECGRFPTIECPVSGCNYKAKLNARMLQHIRMVHKL